MAKNLLRNLFLVLFTVVGINVNAQDVTALWDFQNLQPATMSEVNIQGTAGDVASTVDGIVMHVDATNNGKLQYNSSGYAQFNANTVIQIPVKNIGDEVTVVSYPGQYKFTVGGVAATGNTTVYSAKSTDKSQGYVEVIATSTAYIYSLQVVQKSAVQEKELYSTIFTEWGSYETKTKEEETAVSWQTKYSAETLTFTLFNVQIGASNFNTGKFPAWEGGMLMCAKSDNPYIITSALASITKVRFVHGATGSNRGYQLWAKGDGDEDWVSVSNTVATTAQGTEVNVDVNRTNCQLKFTNLNSSQNAYLLELDIYGNVDMSSTPMLGTFSVNGTKYTAGDIFEQASDGTMTATIEISNSETMISAENPLTDVVAENGTVGEITYEMSGGNAIVTIPVILGEGDAAKTVVYKATIVYKEYFTLTYYDTDGTSYATQQVEKDATIGTLQEYTETIGDGKIFRGWYAEADGGLKYTADYVVTGNTSLYALVNGIEVASTSERYVYDLTSKYFYDEDHEAFNSVGSGVYHDGTHGWVFKAGDKIDILVGGHAYIIMNTCRYSSEGTISLTDAEDNVVGTAVAKGTTDGEAAAIEYKGAAGTLSLVFDGTTYLHKLTINNVEADNIEKNEQGYFVVKAGNAKHLLSVIDIANAVATDDARTYIFVPDGLYDMGETVLTPIAGNNISIIGQSMEGTIIKNAPDVSIEGIGTTATFLVTGSNTYFQDLTIQNALDYYASGSAGRAVCIQDRGDMTICKNVKMLSYQDTYYSNNDSGKFYWEDSEIHGTVDYICGSGDAYFKNCTLVNESRAADSKSGSATITAPYTSDSEYGYVFEGCTVENKAASFNFGRAWGGTPRLAFLNTTLNQPDEIASTRFTAAGMNVAADKFVEYNSVDANGTVVSPASNIVTFTKDATSNTMETIINAEQAKAYDIDSVFKTWSPDELTAQVEISGNVAESGSELTWNAAEDAIAYAVFNNGEFVTLVSTPSYTITEGEAANYTVRAANAMGGFGASISVKDAAGINNVEGSTVSDIEYYNLQGQKVGKSYGGVQVKVMTMSNGTKQTIKVIK